MKTVTTQEREEFFTFWLIQRNAIQGKVSDETMRWFNIYTDHNNVGYEFGQLRPGKLGQWDLYWALTGDQSVGCNESETILASGLTVAEIAEEKRREGYRDHGVNADNAIAVAVFERINRMNPDELDSVIMQLEQRIAECGPVTA
jgi:hypothetical protein